MTNVEIREERPADHEGIREVNRLAFDGEGEGRLVDQLRADGVVIASLVAVDGDGVVGHVLFSELPIETADGVIRGAALAPVSVRPERQRQGIGSALIRRGLDLSRERGYAAVVVLGSPDYYGRFGFTADLARSLQAPYSGPAFMGLEIEPGVLAFGGVVQYPAAFRALD